MNRFGKIAIALLLLAALFVVAVPNLLSSTLVKQRIADQLTELTGRSVSLTGGSRVSLSPYLGVSYDTVVIKDAADAEGKPLVIIEELKAKLGLLAAIIGNVQVAELTFIRPHFHLRRDENGLSNWQPGPGTFGRAIGDRDNPSDLRLGSVEVKDGIIDYIDEQSKTAHGLTAVNSTFQWPSTQSAFTANGTAVWRGEVVSFEASVSKPALLLTNGESAVSLRFDATPAGFTFDGTVNRDTSVSNGNLSISTASPNRLAEWLQMDRPAARLLPEFKVAGQASLKPDSIEFPEATLSIGDHAANGRIQLVQQEDSTIALTGTLAFETMSLPSISSLLGGGLTEEETQSQISLSWLEGIALDMRLSAQSAQHHSFDPPLELSGLAASVIIRDKGAKFDIGQAEALGGTITGSLDLKDENETTAVSSSISLIEVNLANLTNLASNGGISLQGSGDLDLTLKSSGTSSRQLATGLNGKGSIRAKDGTLLGLDVTKIYNDAKSGDNSVTQISDDTTAFEKLDLEFIIANGTAFMRKSSLGSEAIFLKLFGRTDLVRQSLALRGIISDPKSENPEVSQLSFFVGGSAAAPLFVPLLDPE